MEKKKNQYKTDEIRELVEQFIKVSTLKDRVRLIGILNGMIYKIKESR